MNIFKWIIFGPLLLWKIRGANRIIRKSKKRPDKYSYEYKYNYVLKTARTIFRLLSVKPVYHNTHFINKKASLIIANHQSYLDALLILDAYSSLKIPQCLGFIAKKELKSDLRFRKILSLIDVLYLDTKSIRKAIEIFKDAKDLINNEKKSVLIFPEGTRSHGFTTNEFKPGAFKLAYSASCSIQPVVIINSFEGYKSHKGTKKVHVFFLESIPYSSFQHLSTLQISELVKTSVDKTLSGFKGE